MGARDSLWWPESVTIEECPAPSTFVGGFFYGLLLGGPGLVGLVLCFNPVILRLPPKCHDDFEGMKEGAQPIVICILIACLAFVIIGFAAVGTAGGFVAGFATACVIVGVASCILAATKKPKSYEIRISG